MTGPMTPLPYRVTGRRAETTDTVTLTLKPAGTAGLGPWRPGQFTMVYAFGVGEVPISISGGDGDGGGDGPDGPGGGDGDGTGGADSADSDGEIRHTVRAVGAVSHAITATPVGGTLWLRGPYGRGWDGAGTGAADLLLVAGGIGLAPLRPVLTGALARRARFGRIVVLVGARTPADLIFTHEYPAWRAAGAEILVTVDRAEAGWSGAVGVVTTLLDWAAPDPARTAAFVCGPETMMRFTARGLAARGVPDTSIQVSLERNMRCGVALCGHCQLGPLLVCRDGPVVGYDVAGPLLAVREL